MTPLSALPDQGNCLNYIASDSNNQVHLMVEHCDVVHSQLLHGPVHGRLVFYLLRPQRLCFDIDESEFEKYVQTGETLPSGYFAHYHPYSFYDRTLFLHHYLPAYNKTNNKMLECMVKRSLIIKMTIVSHKS